MNSGSTPRPSILNQHASQWKSLLSVLNFCLDLISRYTSLEN